MNPDETLQKARDMAERLLGALDAEHHDPTYAADVCHAANELAIAFQALDGWLSTGNYWPAAWVSARRP